MNNKKSRGSQAPKALKRWVYYNPPPKNWRPNSADLADLFRRFVGFLNFADLFLPSIFHQTAAVHSHTTAQGPCTD